MEKDKEQIKALREQYEKACNAYREILESRWGVQCEWSGFDCDLLWFCESECLTMSDLILCVEENIGIEEYFEWSKYNEFAREFNQNVINLRSWHMGYHGIPMDEQETLRKLKTDFEDTIASYKETY